MLTSSSVSRLSPDPGVGTAYNANPLFRSFGRVGEVVDGMDVVRLVEAEGTAAGNPKKKIVIENCGTL